MKRKQLSLSPTLLLRLAILVAAVVLIVVLIKCSKPSLGVAAEGRMYLTPTQIKKIRDIGEWEFLTIEDEEVVDTSAQGLLSTRELVRVYFGTLRLGIDMSKVGNNWLSYHGDTVVALLPPVQLLSDDFIDEARTKTFYEEGSWSEADRERLYHKAKRMMKRRCLTKANYASAEAAATTHFAQMLEAMGFPLSRVSCQPRPKEKALTPMERLQRRWLEWLDEE